MSQTGNVEMSHSPSPKEAKNELSKMRSSLGGALRREETPGEVSGDEFTGDLDTNILDDDEKDSLSMITGPKEDEIERVPEATNDIQVITPDVSVQRASKVIESRK